MTDLRDLVLSEGDPSPSGGCSLCRRHPEFASTLKEVMLIAVDTGKRLSTYRLAQIAATRHPECVSLNESYVGKHLRRCEGSLWAKVNPR